MTRDQFISIFFIALLVFIVYQIFHIFSPFVKAIFWASILVFACYPIYAKLLKTLKGRSILTSALMTLALFLIIVPTSILIAYNISGQAIELYQSASNYVREGRLNELVEQVKTNTVFQRLTLGVFQFEPIEQSLSDWILNAARSIGNFAVIQASVLTKNVFLVILNILLTFVLVFVFFKDGEKVYQFVYQIAPLEKSSKKSIFAQINETFSAVIRGQLLTAVAQASIAAIVFWILGIRLPLFFAALTFFTSMIPILGASAVWLPLVAYLVIQGENMKAGILFAFGVLVISMVDNIMKPALIGERTKLPYFLLLFGILGGIKIYGLVGIFIAPVVLSLFFALVKIYEEKYL